MGLLEHNDVQRDVDTQGIDTWRVWQEDAAAV